MTSRVLAAVVALLCLAGATALLVVLSTANWRFLGEAGIFFANAQRVPYIRFSLALSLITVLAATANSGWVRRWEPGAFIPYGFGVFPFAVLLLSWDFPPETLAGLSSKLGYGLLCVMHCIAYWLISRNLVRPRESDSG